jgi:hypothetical protein
MKHLCKTSMITIVIAISGMAMAQPPQLRIDPQDLQRELSIAPVLRTRLQQTRTRIAQRKLSFGVGYHEVLDKPLATITGGERITDASVVQRQNALAAPLILQDNKAREAAVLKNPNLRQQIPLLRLAPTTQSKLWDWRAVGEVTGIRNQKWGTCWAYASIASLESAYLLQNDQSIDASEQYVITNSGAMCPANPDPTKDKRPGGWCYKAVEYLASKGTVSETDCPDTGGYGTPDPNVKKPYGGVAWGFCKGTNGVASVEEIKKALCEYGPVTTWIDAGGTFGSYTKGVYDDDDDKDPGHKVGGHFVLIVGWDDKRGAWLIKNSWGADWGSSCGADDNERGAPGKRGYMWIKYGCHGVGGDATWIRARSKFYGVMLSPIRIDTTKPINPVINKPIIK